MRRTCLSALAILSLTFPAAAQSASNFQWSGTVAKGKTIEIKGVNGEIRAELATGSQVEVRATKRARRSDPATVTIQTAEEGGNITICAIYPPRQASSLPGRRDRDDRPNECRVGDAGRISSHDNDVVVDFVVRVPPDVRFVGRTVNGAVDARGLKSDVAVNTVNGRIDLTTTGIGSAETVNGSIDATVGSTNWSGRLEFNTVNGSITLRLPKGLDTNLRARMTNGRFDSDFPVSIEDFRTRSRRVVGVIGKGGRDLEVETVNGSISLRFVPN